MPHRSHRRTRRRRLELAALAALILLVAAVVSLWAKDGRLFLGVVGLLLLYAAAEWLFWTGVYWLSDRLGRRR